MSVGISLEELLAWNEQSAAYWKTHLETNPALLELPCDIGGTANVQGFVRHIWGAEPGASRSCSISIGCLRSSAPSRGERLPCTPCSTASATGRNWRH